MKLLFVKLYHNDIPLDFLLVYLLISIKYNSAFSILLAYLYINYICYLASSFLSFAIRYFIDSFFISVNKAIIVIIYKDTGKCTYIILHLSVCCKATVS